MANILTKGVYVLTECENAFNKKKSYWISKEGYTISLYCFTANSKSELEEQLKQFDSYINYFEEYMRQHHKKADKVYVTCDGREYPFSNRDEALLYFETAMFMADGEERERYVRIHKQLRAGWVKCSDKEDVAC